MLQSFKKKFNKLQYKIILMVLIPICFCGTISSKVYGKLIYNVSALQVESKVKTAGDLVLHELDNLNQFDYVFEDGTLKKGDLVLSDNENWINEIKDLIGLDFFISYGDDEVLSTTDDYTMSKLLTDEAKSSLRSDGSYFVTDKVIDGRTYGVYGIPLKNGQETIGYLFLTYDVTDFNKSIQSQRLITLLIVNGASLSVSTTAFFVILMICSSIKFILKCVESLGNGELDIEIPEKYTKHGDEIGQVVRAICVLKDNLSKVIGDIKGTSTLLLDSSTTLEDTYKAVEEKIDMVNHTIEEVARGASSQASDTMTANESVMKIGEEIKKTLEVTEVLTSNTSDVKKANEKNIEALNSLVNANGQTKELVAEITEQTKGNNVATRKIEEAIKLITNIASETNLLSLNASIEAAKAGAAGNGFAVVANQIKKLAEQSNQSAKVIESTVKELIIRSEDTVTAMNNIQSVVDNQNDTIALTQKVFDELTEKNGQVFSAVEDIVETVNRLNESRLSINSVVQDLSALAEENAASSEESSASLESVVEDFSKLQNLMDDLKNSSVVLSDNLKSFHIKEDA